MSTETRETLTRWDPSEFIETPEETLIFLNFCVEEDEDAEADGKVILGALGSIARAQRRMSGIARDADLNRSNLHKALSSDGNPTFATVLKVVTALGLRLRFELTETDRAPED